jgi:predicted Zn finger-like uncharacterized protein
MIIICPSCEKSFQVDDNLIPENGRFLKCGSCYQTWFFDFNKQKQSSSSEPKIFKKKSSTIKKKNNQIYAEIKNDTSKIDNNKKNYEITEYKEKKIFSFGNFLSYILVCIVSFVGVIIIIDTFSSPLYKFYPNLELILFNLFETLKDIKLFIKDLI